MNKRNLLFVMLSFLMILVIFLMPNSRTYQLSEKANSEDYPNEYLPCMFWNGVYYEKDEIIGMEDVKPDKLGKITENLDLSELPEKNGQSNSPIIPVGAEIYPMLDGKDLAMYSDGRWWRLIRQEE